MYLTNCNKILSVFIYYNNSEIYSINFKNIKSTDTGAKTSEIVNMAEFLRKRRGLKSQSNKIGRNELCPCGSGKKYKKCCGR